MDYAKIMNLEPEQLLEWAQSQFTDKVDLDINDIDFGIKAGELLLKLGNEYAYLQMLSVYADRCVRLTKRNKANTDEISDVICKRDAIKTFTERAKQLYAAVSRAGAMKTEYNKELMLLKE